MKDELCTRPGCGQTVKWGWRHGRETYLHRLDVDHEPVFGRRFTADDAARVERELDLPRERHIKVDPEGFPLLFEIDVYTARGERLKAMKKAARDRMLEEGLDEEEIAALEIPIPEPEVRKTPIERDDPRCPQGVKNVMNAAARAGWRVTRLTYARGPYLGAKGQVLSISDSVVLHVVDDRGHAGVASWRDGKATVAFHGPLRGRCDMIGITELKNRMKGAPSV